MQIVPVREAKDGLPALLKECQKEPIIITRHGRPVAIVTGVEGQDLSDLIERENARTRAGKGRR